MRLDVLGSSGSGPVPGNPGSGYLVRAGGVAILADAGPGTFMRLAELCPPERLAAVVVSHVHPDHCSDIFALYGYLAHRLGHPRPMPLLAPPGGGDHLAGFLGSSADSFRGAFDVTEVDGGHAARFGEVTLRFARTTHPVPTVAARFDAGAASLAYSADTGPGGGFPDLAAGADVVLCEATLEERSESSYPYHLTAAEAGSIAAAAGAGRLVVTHLGPTLPPGVATAHARSEFGGGIDVAAPGFSHLWEESR